MTQIDKIIRKTVALYLADNEHEQINPVMVF